MTDEALPRLDGDTAFMRHPELTRSDAFGSRPELVRQFQAAEMANDSAVARDILRTIADDRGLPEVLRFRALIGMARASYRSGNLSTARAELEQAGLILTEPPPLLADLAYWEGLVAAAQGDLESAFGRFLAAIGQDPLFARAYRLAVSAGFDLLRYPAGRETERTPLATLTDVVQAVDALEQLPAGRRYLIDLANELSEQGCSKVECSLVLGLVWRVAGNSQAMRLAAADGLARCAREGRRCPDWLMKRLEVLDRKSVV